MRLETGPISQHEMYWKQRYFRCFHEILNSGRRELSTVYRVVFIISGKSVLWQNRNVTGIEENLESGTLTKLPSFVFMDRLETLYCSVKINQSTAKFSDIGYSLKENAVGFKGMLEVLRKKGVNDCKIKQAVGMQFNVHTLKNPSIIIWERVNYLLQKMEV